MSSTQRMPPRRMLLVHAHPDDETIATGVTMAHYLDHGAQVTLVTCTLGEEGEVLTPGLEHLAASRERCAGCTSSGGNVGRDENPRSDRPPLPGRRRKVSRLGDDG